MFSLYSPSECMSKLKQHISAEQKIAFFSTFLIGFFTHLFIFTNSMYNNDDIRYLYVTFDKPELGRWLQTYAAGISSFFSMPVVNGTLSLIYLGIASMVLVSMFELKNRPGIILLSGLLVTFPTVTCIFSFMFTADGFFLACLLSILAAYFVTRVDQKWAWIAGAVCLCCSVGIYQAYLPFTLVLMLLYYILTLLQKDCYDDKKILLVGFRYVAMLILGMTAYYIFMKLTLKIKHIELSSYQGIGESDFPTPSEILNRFSTLLHDFIDFFKPEQVLALNIWLRIGLVLSILLLFTFFFTFFIKQKIYKEPLRIFLLLFSITCIPPAVNVIYLISDGVTFHMLMRHAWCVFFMAVIIFMEKCAPLIPDMRKKLLEWIACVALLLTVFNYFLLANIAYFNMNFRYEKTYALCIKIVDRIEQSEDYDNNRPIAFIGNYSKTYKMEACQDLLATFTGTTGPLVFKGASRAFQPFMQNCLGEDITIATPEEEDAIKQTEAFKEMPRFPKAGSVQVINDITVVKLNDN